VPTSVRKSGPMDRKKTENRTELDRKKPDRQSGFFVFGIEKPAKDRLHRTGFDRFGPVPHSPTFSGQNAPTFKEIGQELSEI